MDENTSKVRTTITVSEELHERLDRLKPYSSMSFNEFLEDLVDAWEPASSNHTEGHPKRDDLQ